LNRLAEALAAFDMAIKLNPAHSNAHYNKGLCSEELNRPEEALSSYGLAVRYNPNNVNALDKQKFLLEKLKSN
jgi:tetratricopeptide (TPR) repeat protein